MHSTAQCSENGLIDAGFCHLRIGYDVAAVAERGDPFCHCIFGEYQIVCVFKVSGGVNSAFDDGFVFGVEYSVPQLLRDKFEAAFLNVHRVDILNHGGVSPLGMRDRN